MFNKKLWTTLHLASRAPDRPPHSSSSSLAAGHLRRRPNRDERVKNLFVSLGKPVSFRVSEYRVLVWGSYCSYHQRFWVR